MKTLKCLLLALYVAYNPMVLGAPPSISNNLHQATTWARQSLVPFDEKTKGKWWGDIEHHVQDRLRLEQSRKSIEKIYDIPGLGDYVFELHDGQHYRFTKSSFQYAKANRYPDATTEWTTLLTEKDIRRLSNFEELLDPLFEENSNFKPENVQLGWNRHISFSPSSKRAIISLLVMTKEPPPMSHLNEIPTIAIEVDLENGGVVGPEREGFSVPLTYKFYSSWSDEDELFIRMGFIDELDDWPTPPVRLWKRDGELRFAPVELEDISSPDDKVDVRLFVDQYRDAGLALKDTWIQKEWEHAPKRTWEIVGSRGQKELVHMPTNAEVNIATFNSESYILIKPLSDWTVGRKQYGSGSLIAFELHPFINEDTSRPHVILEADNTKARALRSFHVTKSHIILSIYEDAILKLHVATPAAGRWEPRALDVGTISKAVHSTVERTDVGSDELLFSNEGLDTPPTLKRGILNEDGELGQLSVVKKTEPVPNAPKIDVDQFKLDDGSQYIIAKPAGVTEASGPMRTLIQVEGPSYSTRNLASYDPVLIDQWIRNGGCYVVAITPGYPELGKGAYEQGTRLKIDNSWKGISAISADLERRGITDQQHRTIIGKGVGALVTQAAIIEDPTAYRAAVLEAPLSDMGHLAAKPMGKKYVGMFTSDKKVTEKYSPIRRIAQAEGESNYPVMMIVTTADDQVFGEAQGQTMAKELRNKGHNVLLMPFNKGTHTMDLPKDDQIRYQANKYEFLRACIEAQGAIPA